MSEQEHTGLRERKKAERKRRMLEAAGALFHERGLDGTTMSAVAGRAGVGVGTLYNYYPSKDTLFIAVLKQSLLSMTGTESGAVASADRDPVEILLGAVKGFLTLLKVHDRSLWLEFAASIYTSGRKLDEPVFELDWMLVAELTNRLILLKERGVLDPNLDPEHGAMLLFACILMQFQMFVLSRDVDPNDLEDMLRRDFARMLRGFYPAEEGE